MIFPFVVPTHTLGVEKNSVSYALILNACSHSGRVDVGFEIMNSITRSKNVAEIMDGKILLSMVDCLGRKNELKQAIRLVSKHWHLRENDIEELLVLYTSLLSSCAVHNNLKMGKKIFKTIDTILANYKSDETGQSGYQMYNNDAATLHVLLANIYAKHGMKLKAKTIHNNMADKHILKVAGMSWIEINGIKHEFMAGDTSHPKYMQIEAEKQRLVWKLKEIGYEFDDSVITRELEECEDSQTHLCGHSEKLAVLFGLISTPNHSELTVTKNLRVCKDCHNVTKLISKFEKRIIKLRDSKRWHVFNNGQCSCRDYF